MWQIYTKRIPPTWDCKEDVLLSASGISISRTLFKIMGEPLCCVLLFDDAQNRIGLLPTDNTDEGMRLWAPKGAETRCFLMAHNFMKQWKLERYAAMALPITTDGNLFVINLPNHTNTAVTDLVQTELGGDGLTDVRVME